MNLGWAYHSKKMYIYRTKLSAYNILFHYILPFGLPLFLLPESFMFNIPKKYYKEEKSKKYGDFWGAPKIELLFEC